MVIKNLKMIQMKMANTKW